MIRLVALTLALTMVCAVVSSCAMRSRHTVDRTVTRSKPVRKDVRAHKTPTPEPPPSEGEQVPNAYAGAMHSVLRQAWIEMIEDSLQVAFEIMERKVGSEKAAIITERDPMFQNEAALVFARKKDLDRAVEHLDRAWRGLHHKTPVTAEYSFRHELYRLNDRLYDNGTAMNPHRDQAIMRAFRDFMFLNKRSERHFIDQVMRRDHRFLPEPAIFPGYFGSIPMEVVNDWYHHARKTDLLSWRRFTHLPVHYSDGHLRQVQRALAANLLVIGILKGDQKIVQRALQRLEHSVPPAGGNFRYDRASRSLLMFGHYILGHQDLAMRYEDRVLKNILVP